MILAQGDTTLTNVYLSLTAFAPDGSGGIGRWSRSCAARGRSKTLSLPSPDFCLLPFATFTNGRFIADVPIPPHKTNTKLHLASARIRITAKAMKINPSFSPITMC
ncbi:MAG: hypothetical protein JNN25_11855 [Candidatus Kapabacteria bacterium]|nr:hypothetical protein [Candidatus Kapabacteria bacterium]